MQILPGSCSPRNCAVVVCGSPPSVFTYHRWSQSSPAVVALIVASPDANALLHRFGRGCDHVTRDSEALHAENPMKERSCLSLSHSLAARPVPFVVCLVTFCG